MSLPRQFSEVLYVLELAQPAVSDDGPEDREEVAQHGKNVIKYCGVVVVHLERVGEKQGQNGCRMKALISLPFSSLTNMGARHRLKN